MEATSTQTIIREISADLETPISVYMKLRGQGASFLLESVEGGERIARYSFIGIKPKAQYIIRGNEIEIIESESSRLVTFDEHVDPTYFLQEEMNRFKFTPQAAVPRFIGGLVGYLGYESVRHFEPTLKSQMKRAAIPDGIYLLADTVVAFDHARRSLSLIANVLDGDVESADHKLDQIELCIEQPLPPTHSHEVKSSKTRSNMTQGRFEDMVRDVKEHIAAGDIFQVVLSQRFTRETNVEPFDVYRAVRRLNPSPYMFFIDYGIVDSEP
jgi:anthranilate synthase component 1